MIPPKTFAQWLANYIDKPTPRGQLARDWALLRAPSEFHTGFTDVELAAFIDRDQWEDEVARMAAMGLWNEGPSYNGAVVYYEARRAYAVYALRHSQRYGREAS